MADLPPQPISQENIVIVRRVGSDGKVVTAYVDKTSGQPLGIQEQRHHQGASAGFIPPPS